MEAPRRGSARPGPRVENPALQNADIEVTIGIAWPQFEPPLQYADGAGVIAAGLANLPEDIIGGGILGINLQQPIEQSGRLFQVAGPKSDFAQMI